MFWSIKERRKREKKYARARIVAARRLERTMALYPVAITAVTEPLEQDPTPAEWMERCCHADACRMQLERLEGPVARDEGFGWVDDLARLLGCGEGCECAE